VIEELAKLAFLDPRKLFNADGSLVPIHELDDDTAACIAGLEVNEMFEGDGEQKHAYGLCKKIKIADKGQSLERLGRYFKLFTDKAEISGKDGAPMELVVRHIGQSSKDYKVRYSDTDEGPDGSVR
jgi:phage terminase small subunit